MSARAGRILGTFGSRGGYAGTHTRIRRRGMAESRNQRVRGIFRQTSIGLGVMFLFALAYVWIRVQVVEVGYRVRQEEIKRDNLTEENRELSVEAATLKSPQRLEIMAAKMGLARPRKEQVVFIEGDL